MPKFFERSLSAEREERGARSLTPRVVAFLGIFLSWWILTALVFDDTQSNFLRGESGWYLFLSHSAPAVQHDFEKALLTKSFNGHYTPFAFLAEFATAKLIGTQAGFWKWRQITLLALLATMLFLFVRNSGAAFQLSRVRASLCAVGVTAVLIFQAQMRHFIAWPFMVLQLFWLLFTVMALTSLVQMARRPAEKLWPWLAGAMAYASLHFLGLGLATVAATATALAGTWLGTRRRDPSNASRLTAPLLSMIALATLHAVVMLGLSWRPAITPAPRWELISFVTEALGFLSNFALATVRNLFSTSPPGAWQNPHDWPYGLAILLGFGFLVGSAFLRLLKEPTARNKIRFILQAFASVSFLTIVALTAARQWHEPSPLGFADFLSGARYLIPSTFALAGVLVELLFLLASAPLFLGAVLNVGLAICAIMGNLQYAAHVYPKVYPGATISHANAWRSVVAMARECRDANLSIPNVPLGALTQEFHDWDLKLFEPLLRADLRVSPGAPLQFTAWPGFTGEIPDEYKPSVPSLGEVRKRLKRETTAIP
ncbi:MAG TPA: hypothetical protein VNP98_10040 [Chthoniobacterales bacterium]|nr:hypothetical protein [Chthoniobacterales bacterium]